MSAKKPQQVKKQEPVQQAEQTAAPAEEPRTTTTIQVSTENKGRLEILKGMLNQPDYNSTISRIIDIIPQKLSTEQEVHLVMTQSKFIWLRGHQDNCDCRRFLDEAKV